LFLPFLVVPLYASPDELCRLAAAACRARVSGRIALPSHKRAPTISNVPMFDRLSPNTTKKPGEGGTGKKHHKIPTRLLAVCDPIVACAGRLSIEEEEE
jgi:hypothetical protein